MNLKRMTSTKNGVKKGIKTILTEFQEESLPNTVFWGFMTYPVTAYMLRPRLWKVWDRSAAQMCGGGHSVADAEYQAMKIEKQVQKVSVERKMSYAFNENNKV